MQWRLRFAFLAFALFLSESSTGVSLGVAVLQKLTQYSKGTPNEETSTEPNLPLGEQIVRYLNKESEKEKYDPSSDQMEKEILSLFGRNNRPHPNLYFRSNGLDMSARSFMYKLYLSVVEGVDHDNETLLEKNQFSPALTNVIEDWVEHEEADIDENPKADMAISFVDHMLSPRPNSTDSDDALYFDLSTNFKFKRIVFSELRVYYNQYSNSAIDKTATVSVMKVVTPGKDYQLIEQKLLTSAVKSGWLIFNVTNVVRDWDMNIAPNNGLVLHAEGKGGIRLSITQAGIMGSRRARNDQRPFLISFTQSASDDDVFFNEVENTKRSVRTVRSIRSISSYMFREKLDGRSGHGKFSSDRGTYCSKNHLYISFESLRWDNWIIAPPGFTASFCRGPCSYPVDAQVNISNHAILQTIMNTLTGGEIPNPDCVPVTLNPLTLLNLDDNGNPVIKSFSDMIVTNCGCR